MSEGFIADPSVGVAWVVPSRAPLDEEGHRLAWVAIHGPVPCVLL